MSMRRCSGRWSICTSRRRGDRCDHTIDIHSFIMTIYIAPLQENY